MQTPAFSLTVHPVRLFYSLLFTLLFAGNALAASIMQTGTHELLTRSELVFEGRVVQKRTERGRNQYLYTFVEFQVIEVLKGSLDSERVTLRFTGGTLDGLTMSMGVRIPDEGEQGIYFVESTTHGLINPFYGWNQGHFTIQDNQVIAGDGNEVLAVELSDSDSEKKISEGVVEGVQTQVNSPVAHSAKTESARQEQQESADSPTPLTAAQFKAQVRALLKQLQQEVAP